MTARQLLAVLLREPLSYRVVRQRGAHRRLRAPGRPTVTWARHDGVTLPGHRVRDVLVRQVGLEEEEARDLL